MILWPFCPGPLGALSSPSPAEPGLGMGVGWGVKQDRTMPTFCTSLKAPNCPSQPGVPVLCHCSKALSGSPSSKARSNALSLAWHFRAFPTQYRPFSPLLSPLVFSAPSFRRLLTKCSPVLLHKFIPSAWKSFLPTTPQPQLKCLLFWEALLDQPAEVKHSLFEHIPEC